MYVGGFDPLPVALGLSVVAAIVVGIVVLIRHLRRG
jgi:uncharacterized membrane protein YfcA